MNATAKNTERDVVLASADATLRQRLRESLTGLRWRVHEASGGAEALTLLERQPSDALLMDGWLPDLEAVELASHIAMMYPAVDVLSVDGGALTSTRSAHRHELLHALREVQQGKTDTAAWNAAPTLVPRTGSGPWGPPQHTLPADVLIDAPVPRLTAVTQTATIPVAAASSPPHMLPIPGLIGESAGMRELTHLIRLVAPRNSTVLIEGETGTGKEVVASAIHRLSNRSSKPLTVLNCAAIPEALLEAELFGHTRGAFTGAVQSRTGRIEAAHGGTLFLDEIGELPLAVQAKLLRFLE